MISAASDNERTHIEAPLATARGADI